MNKRRLIAAIAAFFMLFCLSCPMKVKAETDDEIMMLTYIVHAEAGNQDLTGKKLVVDVVLNRLHDSRFPDTIEEVIFQKYQFSPIRDGGYERAKTTWTEEDYQAVVEELIDQVDYDVIYFNGGGYPAYGAPAFQHGDHYFSK